MTYTLYYSPGAASMAVHWMLIELGVPFELRLVDLDAGAQKTEEYRRLNTAGRVPTLIVDDAPRGESVALLMLLAERHPETALAPLPGSRERTEWLEYMIYMANTLLPAMRDWFYSGVDGDPAGADAVKALAQRRIEQSWDRLENELIDGRQYLVGGKLSTVDFLAIMLMRWARNMPRPATNWPRLARYIEGLRARAAYIALNEKEGLSDWLNVSIAS